MTGHHLRNYTQSFRTGRISRRIVGRLNDVAWLPPITTPFERANQVASRQSEDAQDALAARILDEIEDERKWDRAFAETTDDQWDQLAALARTGIEAGNAAALDVLIEPECECIQRQLDDEFHGVLRPPTLSS